MTLQEIPAVGTPEWVEARRSFIGASDAPAVLGLSPWATPLDVWADKLDIGTRFTGNLSTDMGHALEEMIASQWMKANPGRVYFAPQTTMRHPELPHVAASVDRCCDVPLDLGPEELIECKFVGPNLAWTWKDGPPLYVRVQVQVQMAVTGAKRVHVCALLYDRQPEWCCWTIEREDDAIASILVRLDQYWREHVETQVRPDVDTRWSAEKTTEALVRIYGEEQRDAQAIRLPSDVVGIVQELKRNQALAKDLEGDIDDLKNLVRDALGDATEGFADDNEKPVVTWRWQNKTTYDTKAVLSGKVDGFSADELDVARRVLLAVQTITPSRVLRVAA